MRFQSSSRTEGEPFTFDHIAAEVLSRAQAIMPKVLEESKKASIEDYKKKRKTKTSISGSNIIASFNYELKGASATSVIGVVFAGGPQAPYMIYVDEGHKYRGGKGSFPGHQFMTVGFEVGERVLEAEMTK